VLAGVIQWLHFASGMQHTTAYLILCHMAPNMGILVFQRKMKRDFSDRFVNSKEGDLSGHFERMLG
jgi:hypothetical protein